MHHIVRRTMLTLLTFQALLCWCSTSACPALVPQPWTGQLPVASPSTMKPLQPDFPNLARSASLGWQRPSSATSPVTWPERGGYNLQATTVCSGHDIVRRTMLTLLTFQVSYLKCAKEFRSSNRYVVAVSCPIDLIFFVYRTCCDMLAQHLLCQLLLLLSGDVELNPGPTKSADLAAILTTLKELQDGQAAILKELNELKEAHDAHKGLLTSLTDRVTKLESFHDHPLAEPVSIESGNLKHDIAALKAASVDVSNRLRRNNLLFLGIDDTDKETWKDSEDKVLAFCKDKLSFEIFPNSIERAHRIGSPSPEKKRPIIVKFMNFKTKEEILSSVLN